MAAIRVPPEVLAMVFSYQEPADFFAARRTCKTWFRASQNIVTLLEQLSQVRMLGWVDVIHYGYNDEREWPELKWPEGDAPAATEEVARLYTNAASSRMLGIRIRRIGVAVGNYKYYSAMNVRKKPHIGRMVLLSSKNLLATIDRSNIVLYDISTIDAGIIDETATPFQIPYQARHCTEELVVALSPDGAIIAAGRRRELQFYRTTLAPRHKHMTRRLSLPIGQSVRRISFDLQGQLLRVETQSIGSNRLRVQFYEVPTLEVADCEHQGLDTNADWNIDHIFLDTADMPEPLQCLHSLHILCSLRDGYLFAAVADCFAVVGYLPSDQTSTPSRTKANLMHVKIIRVYDNLALRPRDTTSGACFCISSDLSFFGAILPRFCSQKCIAVGALPNMTKIEALIARAEPGVIPRMSGVTERVLHPGIMHGWQLADEIYGGWWRVLELCFVEDEATTEHHRRLQLTTKKATSIWEVLIT